MAQNYEKFSSPGKGNGLRATKDLSLGLLLGSEMPYVYTLCREKSKVNACDNCLRRQDKLLRCSQCKFARYCDSRCQRDAWKDHKRECICLKDVSPNVPTALVRLVGKIIFNLLQQPVCPSEDLYSIYDLESHIKDLSQDIKEGLGHLATTLQLYLKREIQDVSQLPPGFNILEYFGKVTCNSFTISNGELLDVAVGIYPSMSLLNHSCDPNCLIVFDGKCLLLQTIKEISKGEELTVSYIDVNRPSHIRQKQLQRQYCFICNCHLCLTKHKDEDMLAGDPQASKEAEGSIARLEELNFQEKWQESLDLSRSLIRSYSGRLPDKNIYQLELLDLAMDAAIALELWEEALHFGLRTLEPFSLYYPHSHPVRALQMNRVGKIQLFLEMYPEAMKMLKQAFDIMKITHGKDHILMKDLIDLLRECEASMKTK